jgi:hypothetical protein
MIKITCFLISIFMLFIVFSCSTKLEIANDTSYTLDLISWYDQDGTAYWFGRDWVWDYVLYEYVPGLYPGSSDEQSVEPGDSPIYFFFADGGPEYRTVDFISVDKNEKESYILTDYTTVIEAGGQSATINEMSALISTTSIGDKNRRLQEYNKMKTEK